MVKIKDIFNKKKKVPEVLDRDYFFEDYIITLKGTHVLDVFQNTFPLYDSFLPYLCSPLKGLIIDIGANIGDTTIGVFAKNNNCFIVGVEPDEEFYKECVYNISRNSLTHRFFGINKFVTTKKGKYIIKKDTKLSTGSIQEIKEENDNVVDNSISFSELMSLIPIDKTENFEVLKIDTDGYDWDILNSFSEYAKTNTNLPKFLFFEMQTFLNGKEKEVEGRDEIIENYSNSFTKIVEVGYSNFCLFDNFGTFIKKTNSIEDIIEMTNYLKRSQLFNNHSTIYYFDILCYSNDEQVYVNTLLNEIYNYENTFRSTNI